MEGLLNKLGIDPDKYAQHDIPLQVLLHGRVMNMLGLDLDPAVATRAASQVLRPQPRPWRVPAGNPPSARKQFTGAMSVVTWNTQAFFAADPQLHAKKGKHVRSLMGSHDIGLWTETHGTLDGNNEWRNPTGCRSWWSPGPSTASAGVGITVQQSLLDRFDKNPKWEVIMPGRAAVLRLDGKDGSLDIFVVYFHTGSTPSEADLHEAGIPQNSHAASCAGLREALRHRLAAKVRPQDQTLSFIGGDFNFVVEERDRFCLPTATPTGQRDLRETSAWKNHVEQRHQLHELYQPAMTYLSPQSRSRIDRFYVSHHGSEYLYRTFSCTALGWCPALSRHRPLSYRKIIPQKSNKAAVPMREATIKHPDFPRQVMLAWQDSRRDNTDASACKQLDLFKQES